MDRSFPTTLLDFQRRFPAEPACAAYLEAVRWPEGFVCPRCHVQAEPSLIATRSTLRQCGACRHQASLTAGTVMHRSKQPLQSWFWAAYLVTTHTPGMSAVQFQRQLGIGRYETAWNLLHKLRAAMVRPQRERIGGNRDDWRIEVDEGYVGGRTRGEGRGVTHKELVAVAVEVRERDKPRRKDGKRTRRDVIAGRLRLRHIPNRSRKTLEGFVQESVEPSSLVITDGWKNYDRLPKLGYRHEAQAIHGDPEVAEAWLPMCHIVISNLKSWLLGIHHGVSAKHLQAYLNEFVFRFNRRFYPMSTVHSVLGIAMRVGGPTYEGLYDGVWRHPGPGGRGGPAEATG